MMSIQKLQQKYLPVIAPEDFFILLAHATEKEKVFLLAHPEYVLSDDTVSLATNYLDRRQRHEPVAYIIGQKEFYGRNFSVGRGVLIPRPETELIVERVIECITSSVSSSKKIAVIDVGTGSGAIIISLFLSLQMNLQKNISWFALESEEAALRYARKNAKHLCSKSEIQFLKSDLLSRVSKKLSSYDEVFVVANLPYLSEALYRSTAPNVKNYEPKSALASGVDGLDHYRRLLCSFAPLAASFLASTLFLEISPEQKKTLIREVATLFPDSIPIIHPDLSGKDRVLELSLP
jgi:release factor glutamine methyltransferase